MTKIYRGLRGLALVNNRTRVLRLYLVESLKSMSTNNIHTATLYLEIPTLFHKSYRIDDIHASNATGPRRRNLDKLAYYQIDYAVNIRF